VKHLEEHRLQTDVHTGDVLFWFTTCGWMMWNWLVSGLASEATLVLYDGSPAHPDVTTLWRLAERCGIDLTVSTALDLSSWDTRPLIPFRNIYFAMLASNNGADTIWCVGVKGDHTPDKSPAAFTRMSEVLSEFADRPIKIDSPFWEMTKTDVVRWYVEAGLPVRDLLDTFSCMEPGGRRVHCGRAVGPHRNRQAVVALDPVQARLDEARRIDPGGRGLGDLLTGHGVKQVGRAPDARDLGSALVGMMVNSHGGRSANIVRTSSQTMRAPAQQKDRILAKKDAMRSAGGVAQRA
jgi:hypothetical protein